MLEPIEQAIELARAGEKSAARQQLLAVLDADPDHEEAWLWLAYCAANREEYSRALRETLRLNPDNAHARRLTLKLAARVRMERTGINPAAQRRETVLRRRRSLLTVAVLVVLLAAGIIGVALSTGYDLTPEVQATPRPTLTTAQRCDATYQAIVAGLVARCDALQPGEICLGNPPLTLTSSASPIENFIQPGARLRLDRFDRLHAEPLNMAAESLGVGLFQGENGVRGLVIGGARLSDITPALDRLSLQSTPALGECPDVSGLLLHAPSQQAIQLNGAAIQWVGTLFIRQTDAFYLQVVEGVARVSAYREESILSDGQALTFPTGRSGSITGLARPAESAALPPFWEQAALTVGLPLAPPPPASVALPMLPLAEDVWLFSADWNGNADIYALDSAGLIAQLTDSPADERFPALSPDGNTLAYTVQEAGGAQLVIRDVLPLDSPPRLLDSAPRISHVSWSGERLIYTSDRGGSAQIWQIEGESAPQRLTDAPEGVIAGALSSEGVLAYSLSDGGLMLGEEQISVDGHAPAWSPDGRVLAFHSTATGGRQVYVYEVESGETRRLPQSLPTGGGYPAWSADGERLAFLSNGELYTLEGDTIQHRLAGQVENPVWGQIAGLEGQGLRPPGRWQVVAYTSPLYDVEMLSADFGLAVGADATILRYENGIWSRVETLRLSAVSGLQGERLTLYGVDLVAPNEAWAVGEQGVLLRWQNGIWTPTESPTRSTLYAIESGWAVGAEGVILRLSVGGIWESHDSPTAQTLTDVHVVSDSEVWVTGENGVLLLWDGQNWQAQLGQAEGALHAYEDGFVAGENGLFTTNPLLSAAPTRFGEVRGLNDLSDSWGVGENGLIIYGQGGTWAAQPSLTRADLYAVDFSSPSDGWGVGGAMLHYTTDESALPAVPAPARPIRNPIAALNEVWTCTLLHEVEAYPYRITFEPAGDDAPILASATLPTFGYSLVLLEGAFSESRAGLDAAWERIDTSGGLAYLTLTETVTLQDRSGGYPFGLTLRLVMRDDGTLRGIAYQGDAPYAEVTECQRRP